jgi:hypothetical protein
VEVWVVVLVLVLALALEVLALVLALVLEALVALVVSEALVVSGPVSDLDQLVWGEVAEAVAMAMVMVLVGHRNEHNSWDLPDIWEGEEEVAGLGTDQAEAAAEEAAGLGTDQAEAEGEEEAAGLGTDRSGVPVLPEFSVSVCPLQDRRSSLGCYSRTHTG